MSAKVLVACFASFGMPDFASFSKNFPSFDQILTNVLKSALSKMDSPKTGFHNGENWICFDNPKQNLTVSANVKREKNQTVLTCVVQGKIAFNYRMDVEKTILHKRMVLIRNDFSGRADATFDIGLVMPKEGAMRFEIKEVHIDHMKLRADIPKPIQRLIQDWVNKELRKKKGEMATKLGDSVRNSH